MTRGFITEDMVEPIIGAIGAFAVLAWSLYSHKVDNQVKALIRADPDVKIIVPDESEHPELTKIANDPRVPQVRYKGST